MKAHGKDPDDEIFLAEDSDIEDLNDICFIIVRFCYTKFDHI